MSDQQQTVDVPSVVHQFKQQVSHLEKNVLAYGDLMRGTNPIVSWTTRSTEDRPLEIQTDLGAVGDPTVLREAMAQTHANGIREGLNQLQGLLNTLQGVMNPPAPPAVTSPPPAPAPALAPLPDHSVAVGVPPVQPTSPSIMPAAPTPGPMAGPTAANVMPVPTAPPIQPQVQPQTGPGGDVLVPPGQGGPNEG